MEYKDYYQTLGVDRKAPANAIRKAYQHLAQKYHPDRNQNDKTAEEKFKQIQEAYAVLKDPEKRQAYDALGSNWKQGQDFRPPPGWDGAQMGGGAWRAQRFAEEDLRGQGFDGFSDFFSQLFGFAERTRGGGSGGFGGFQQAGEDERATITISLQEAFHGAVKTIQLSTPAGIGRSSRAVTRTLNVRIPAGALPGQQLRLAKQGMPGRSGGSAGDLYLEIAIAPDPLYSLHEHDIHLTLPITPWEAALGASINVPTLNGPVTLKVAAGSHSGQKLRLKGRGMPGKTTGDQIVVLKIETPPARTAEDRAFYKKMAEVMPFNPRPTAS